MSESVRLVAEALRIHVAERRDFVIVHADRTRNYYVQCPNFDPDREELLAEAVSDEWLEPPNLLGQAGAAALRALGWTAPGSASSNWHQVFWIEAELSYEAIADELVGRLQTVYGLRGNPDIEIAAEDSW